MKVIAIQDKQRDLRLRTPRRLFSIHITITLSKSCYYISRRTTTCTIARLDRRPRPAETGPLVAAATPYIFADWLLSVSSL